MRIGTSPNGPDEITVQYQTAFANPSAIGATPVVAAQAGKSIYVVATFIVNGATANSVKFQGAAADISALCALAANGVLVLPRNDRGWFNTGVGNALNINLSGATTVGVTVVYYVL